MLEVPVYLWYIFKVALSNISFRAPAVAARIMDEFKRPCTAGPKLAYVRCPFIRLLECLRREFFGDILFCYREYQNKSEKRHRYNSKSKSKATSLPVHMKHICIDFTCSLNDLICVRGRAAVRLCAPYSMVYIETFFPGKL